MEGAAVAAIIAAAIEAAKAASILGTIVCGVLAYVFYNQMQRERTERIALQDRVLGTADKPGMQDKMIDAFGANTVALNSLKDITRPVVEAAIEKLHAGDRNRRS